MFQIVCEYKVGKEYIKRKKTEEWQLGFLLCYIWIRKSKESCFVCYRLFLSMFMCICFRIETPSEGKDKRP